MANHNVPYLCRRGSVFWFRMPVPAGLVDRVGRREIKLSLRTSHPALARTRCRLLTGEFAETFVRVKPMPTLTRDAIALIANLSFARSMEDVDELANHMIPHDPGIDIDFEVRSSLKDAQKLQKSLLVRPLDPITIQQAKSALVRSGFAGARPGIEVFDALCSAVQRGRIEALRIYAAKLSGRYDEAVPRDPLFAVAGPAVSTVAGGETLAELTDRYCKFKAGREWVAKSATDNRRILDLFIGLTGGERAIGSLADEDIRAYRDALQVLPANYAKRKGAERGNPKAAIAKTTGKDAISKPTARKYFDNVRAFLNWCVDEGYLKEMPGRRVRGFTHRRPFTHSSSI